MSISGRIPSVSVPFVDSHGRISPIWHEFLRQFVAASVNGTIGAAGTASSIVAGAGLTSTTLGNTATLNVGTGPGIAVNANDVGVDIINQTSGQVTLDDEFLFSDVSENNLIKKTQVRNIVALSEVPVGGADTNVQFNNAGALGGDSGFTYGAGSGYLSTSLTVGASGVRISSGAVDTQYFDGLTAADAAHIQSDGAGGFTLYSGYSGGTEQVGLYVKSASPYGMTFVFSSGRLVTLSSTGVAFSGALPLSRCISATVTANVLQSQGNTLLTGDYNNVSTVANANDVVTLPEAFAARMCFVINNGANTLQIYPSSGDDLGNGVNASTTLNPGAHAVWVAIDAVTWYQKEGYMRNSVAATITASTTQTQGQQPLTKDVNEISVCANANDVVTMPTAPAYSRNVRIINNGAQTLQIFPATGDNLGAGVNTSVTLASGANVCYTNYDVTNWEAI